MQWDSTCSDGSSSVSFFCQFYEASRVLNSGHDTAFMMWIASLRSSIALSGIFFLLWITFLLLGIGEFVETTAVTVGGGYFGLFTAFVRLFLRPCISTLLTFTLRSTARLVCSCEWSSLFLKNSAAIFVAHRSVG